MRKLFQLLTSSSLLAVTSLSFADTVEADRDTEDQDIQAIKEWINNQRTVSLKEIGGDLSISGEVRTEFQAAWETRNGHKQRGSSLSHRLPGRGFDVEVNLMFDYRNDFTWAAMKIEFDNDMGVVSGTLSKIALERAYWGVRIVDTDKATFDVEVGRRAMSSIFDSKIQFGSLFDGALLRYAHAFEKVGDYYFHLGAFIVNDRKDQFGYVGEMGLLNIGGTGLYSKISLIDWNTKHYHSPFMRNRFRFLVSQLIGGYRFKLPCTEKMGLFYSAFLWNFAARKLAVSDYRRANWGAYAGLSLGQLRKQWDWAFDINYQAVAPQALPDFDASGIGPGNADSSGFYTQSIRFLRPDDKGFGPSTLQTAGGRTNYQGLSISCDLLLTDKLDWQQSFVYSKTLDHRIGPKRTFLQYEMEFIYTW